MQSASLTSPAVLADTIRLPRLSGAAADAVRVAGGVLLVSVLAQVVVRLPFTPVPFTGQTLGVLLCASSLGTRRGSIALSIYLLLGAVGMPVLAAGQSGVTHFAGNTAGYLLAYPVAAALVGRMAEHGWDRTPLKSAFSMAIGCLLILTVGSLWLSMYVGGIATGFKFGFAPFVTVEAMKILAAAGVIPAMWKLRKP